MKNILFFIFFIISFAKADQGLDLNADLSLEANTTKPKIIRATYSITFGILGEIARAKATLISQNDSYTITMDAKTTGIAYLIAGDRKEFFVSKGKIINNMYTPKTYSHKIERTYQQTDYSKKTKSIFKPKKTIKKLSEDYFEFFHAEKNVSHKSLRQENGVGKMGTWEGFEYYASNDLLSLFFNFGRLKKDTKNFSLYAVGANKTDGRVDILVPNGKKLADLKDDLDQNVGEFLIVYINQQIFSSKRGELFVNIQNGICESAVLKDVLLFGDITATRVE